MKSKNKKVYKQLLTIVFIVILLVIFIVDSIIRTLLIRINETVIKNSVAETVSLCVNNILNDNSDEIENMITYTISDAGGITSADYNCVLINMISAEATNLLSSHYSEAITRDFKTRLGDLTGIPMVFGKGPELKYKLSYIGYPQIEFFSEFSSQGINQTRHRIIMRIKVTVDTIIFLYDESIDYEFDYIVCDSIIVGNVPDSFTQIAGDDREDISKINDYK